eukprot:scaffold105346_cov60-Phaeocystis_antarctica.AAC.1
MPPRSPDDMPSTSSMIRAMRLVPPVPGEGQGWGCSPPAAKSAMEVLPTRSSAHACRAFLERASLALSSTTSKPKPCSRTHAAVGGLEGYSCIACVLCRLCCRPRGGGVLPWCKILYALQRTVQSRVL